MTIFISLWIIAAAVMGFFGIEGTSIQRLGAAVIAALMSLLPLIVVILCFYGLKSCVSVTSM